MGRYIVFDSLPSNTDSPRLGMSVKKAFGNAAERNRFKRQIREIFRLHRHQLPHLSLVVRPRSHAKEAPFSEILNEFLKLIPCNS